MIAIIIAMIIITLSVLPLRMRVMAFLDVIKGKGYFSMRIAGRSFFSGLLLLKGNTILLKRKRKQIEIHLSADKTDEHSVAAYLSRPLAKLIFLKSAHVYFEAGKSDNAMFSAMISAIVQNILSVVFTLLQNRYKGMELIQDYRAVYDKDEFELTLNGIISFSVADIIVGLFLELFSASSRQKAKGDIK